MDLFVNRNNNVVLDEKREYLGWINSYKVLDDGRLWVFVVLDDDDDKGMYLYSVSINTNANSYFVHFCESMGIVDDNDKIHLDWLEQVECPVWVRFKKMPDGTMLIRRMRWHEGILNELLEENENE